MANIIIHRGQNQIGGSIIEISTDTTRIVFDIGINLDEDGEPEIPSIDGLFIGEATVDAVFISHYHADHIGLIDKLLPGIPVYVGQKAFDILKASKEYLKRDIFDEPNHLYDGESILIGDMEIVPIACDHSAYDSYMFEIITSGKKILYTGDFRSNGRKEFDVLLKRLHHVDALIIEGTMLSRDTYENNITEEKLENIAIEALKKYTGPCFVEVSALNVDRLITLKYIAKKTGRTLLLDTYIASVMRNVGGEAPIPDKDKNIRVFLTHPKDHDLLDSFGNAKIGRDSIAQLDYIMCVRSSMRNYLDKLRKEQEFNNGVLFYSMWSGYMEEEREKKFIAFMKEKGVILHKLHTSGHADINTIKSIVRHTTPSKLIPVHTENALWYEQEYSTDINVITDENVVVI